MMSINDQSYNVRSFLKSRLENVCKLISAGTAVCVPANKFQHAERMSAALEYDEKLTGEWPGRMYNDNLKLALKNKPRAPKMRSNITKETSPGHRKGSGHIPKLARRGKKTSAARPRFVKSNRGIRRKRTAFNRGAQGKCVTPSSAKTRSSTPNQPTETLECFASYLAQTETKLPKKVANGHPANIPTLHQTNTIVSTAAQDEATRTNCLGQKLSTTQYRNDASDMLQHAARRKLLGGGPLQNLSLSELQPNQDADIASAPVHSLQQTGGDSQSLQEAMRFLHEGTEEYGTEKELRKLHEGIRKYGTNEERSRPPRFVHGGSTADCRPCCRARTSPYFVLMSAMSCPDTENMDGEIRTEFPEERTRRYPTGKSLSEKFRTVWDVDPPIFKKDPFITGAWYDEQDGNRTSPEQGATLFFDYGVAEAEEGDRSYDSLMSAVRAANRCGLLASAFFRAQQPGDFPRHCRMWMKVHVHGRSIDQLEQLADRNTLKAVLEIINSKDIPTKSGKTRTRSVAEKLSSDLVDGYLSSGVYIANISPEMVIFDPKSEYPFFAIPYKDVSCAGEVTRRALNGDVVHTSGYNMRTDLLCAIQDFLQAALTYVKEHNVDLTNVENSTSFPSHKRRFGRRWPVPIGRE